jgi:hypothetical protein
MLPSASPQTFTTFTTFTTFAKFAKFATFDPTLDHPTLLHRHAPRLPAISERVVTPHPPLSGLRRERGVGG